MNKKELAKQLLSIKAVELRPNNLFTWASGIKSPIYCDNRQTLSFPEIRKSIQMQFAKIIKETYPEVEIIAGVATGAIAHGVLVAQEMNLPFIYVRSSPKGHGRQNLIEGKFDKNQKVVVIEDLISTGGSSIAAVEAIRNANLDVLGLFAIFSYGFDIATESFKQANCNFNVLTNFETLTEVALKEKYISEKDFEFLQAWRKEYSSGM